MKAHLKKVWLHALIILLSIDHSTTTTWAI